MNPKKIILPNNWSPRDYQVPAWNALRELTSSQSSLSEVSLCWHRRSGKDDVDLHHNACAAFERVGNYWYMLPKYKQCRKAIWTAINPHTGKKRIDEVFPKELRSNTLEQEMQIDFKNGSTWQLMGSDNYDALVGAPPVGLTFSEYAISNPSSWGYLSPIILENNGWAVFNGTPRGKNHFYRQIQSANNDPDWYSQILTANDTNVFTEKQLKKELIRYQDEHDETYGYALWLQEYFCSFDAAIPGSIWGESLAKVETMGRVGIVKHTDGYPVHSAWDLGHGDATAIWFYQVVNEEIRIIGCYSNNFKDPDFYAIMLHKKSKDWRFGTHWLPHDARPRRMGMGAGTILQQFVNLAKELKDIGPKGISTDFSLNDDDLARTSDIGQFAITPSFSIKDGIDAARKTLKRAFFDVSTAQGLDALKAYHRTYDEEKKNFSEDPCHDWSSHYSDAFRYLSLTWRESAKAQIILSPHQKLMAGNITQVSFGTLKKRHFNAKRRERRDRY